MVKGMQLSAQHILMYPFIGKLVKLLIDTTEEIVMKQPDDLAHEEYVDILLKKSSVSIHNLRESMKEVSTNLVAACGPNAKVDCPEVHSAATYVERVSECVVKNFVEAIVQHATRALEGIQKEAAQTKKLLDEVLEKEQIDLDALANVAMEHASAKELFVQWMKWKQFAEVPKQVIKKVGMPEQTFADVDAQIDAVLREGGCGSVVASLLLISTALRPLQEGETRAKIIRQAKAATTKEGFVVDDKIQLLTTQLSRG